MKDMIFRSKTGETIIFDKFVNAVDPKDNIFLSSLCPNCYKKYKNILGKRIGLIYDELGAPYCSVQGCTNKAYYKVHFCEEEVSVVKNMDNAIEKLKNRIDHLQEQLSASEHQLDCLIAEQKIAKTEEKEAFIDAWLYKNFEIKSQKEARKNSFLVFDKKGQFVKTVTVGLESDFHYVGPKEKTDTLEHWLKENKLYAHNACSFCDRAPGWYRMTFKQQLESLGWKFSNDGKIVGTLW